MVTKELIIQNEAGLHARPASLLVQKANKFVSTITITVDGKQGNAKSILSVLKLGVTKGKKVMITASGDDESLAISEIINLLNDLAKEEQEKLSQ